MAATFSFSGNYQLQLSATLREILGTNTVPDSFTAGAGQVPAIKNALTNGAGFKLAATQWKDTRTLGATTFEDLQLNAGSLQDAFGRTLAFTLVKWFLIRIRGPATGIQLKIGAAASNAWKAWFDNANDTMSFNSLLFMEDLDGWACGGGAGTTLRVNNPNAASVTYDILVAGN